MRILLCNERFIFRFGVDRVLILLGRGLKEHGHSVSIMANKYDREVIESFADKIIEIPVDIDDYINQNDRAVDWIKNNWDLSIDRDTVPDLVIVAGWPFYASIPFFRQKVGRVIFHDYGAVPMDGFSGLGLKVQQKLRFLRKTYIQKASEVIAISDFIRKTQSISDCGGAIPSKTIHLSADYLDTSIWREETPCFGLSLIRECKKDNIKTILNLGRWEINNYKNSEAAFTVVPRIQAVVPEAILLVLGDAGTCSVPSHLKYSIIPIGFPGDKEMQEIMTQVDLGISFSLWEGFNLPLAEMQWLKKPALVFDAGAHPEVVIHPWYLCQDEDELIRKASEILTGRGPDSEVISFNLKKFHDYFTTERFINDFLEVIDNGVDHHPVVKEGFNELCVMIDVSNSATNTSNSGILRVTRRLSRELQKLINPIFVIWDEAEQGLVLPTAEEFATLSSYNGPVLFDRLYLSPSREKRIQLKNILDTYQSRIKWLLLPEMAMGSFGPIIDFARRHAISLGSIFYDAIPLLRPDLCAAGVAANHSAYMTNMAGVDLVFPISHYSGSCLSDFWNNKGASAQVMDELLPGEFGSAPRNRDRYQWNSKEFSILCVSTLEPRKNHKRLLEALLLLEQRHPEVHWKLVLVGATYFNDSEISGYVDNLCNRNTRIKWLKVVDDDTMITLYRDSAFTVYPSLIEGYGMPIVESIWHGRPCICSKDGVMGELARDGGCLGVDVENIEEICNAIYRLSTDRDLYEGLFDEAISRKIKTWEEYAMNIIKAMKNFKAEKKSAGGNAIDEIVYAGCLTENWQMNHSERLALKGILHSIKPRVVIEVGTYQGGSLSLMAQYAEKIYSIDIDPDIPARYSYMKNVQFITGPSEVTFTGLLEDMQKRNTPVDLILIDGDHSTKGVMKDIRVLLNYKPIGPTIVILHDSFNPGCRKGMVDSPWDSSPHVHMVEIDFVPGAMATPNEMWGGLGFALLLPEKRKGPLRVGRHNDLVFQVIEKSIR